MTTIQDLPFANHLRNEARRLRKANSELSQTAALDVIAKQHGYQNWRHFTNKPQNVPTFPVLIESVWSDKGLGRWLEQIHLNLNTNLLGHRTQSNILQVMPSGTWIDLEKNRIVVPQRFNTSIFSEDKQRVVREMLSTIARHILFMDATGLIPANAWKTALRAIPLHKRESRLPCFDHQKVWRDSEGRYLVTSEPYPEKFQDQLPILHELVAPHGYQLSTPKWSGMWNPSHHGTRLLLLAHQKHGVDLSRISKILDQLPERFIPDMPWQGISTKM